MKKLRTILTILFIALMMGGMTSCEVSRHADNGRHRGWHHRHEYNDDHRGSAVIVIEKKHHGDRDDDH